MNRITEIHKAAASKDLEYLKVKLFSKDFVVAKNVLENPDFDWSYIPEAVNSRKLDRDVVSLIFANTENFSMVDIDQNAILEWAEAHTSKDYNVLCMNLNDLFKLTTNSVYVNHLKHPDDKFVAFPPDFVEKLYNLIWRKFNPNQMYKNDPVLWLNFLAYPGLSDDFKKRVWEERKEDIRKDIEYDLYELKYLIWEHVPGYILINIYKFEYDEFFASNQAKYNLVNWKQAVVSDLQTVYPDISLESVPMEWLFEFYKNENVSESEL